MFSSAFTVASAVPTEIVYLSGQGPATAVPWEFFCTKGRQSGVWTNIAVPSNWELQGFGNYNYGHDVPKHDEQGLYRNRFAAPESWRGKRVRLVFDGVMTDTEVKINGQSAGPVHQGGFYRFRYDITALLKLGTENLLEVTVSKVSADKSVEAAERKADYWVFGGIFRPVYLEVMPAEFIDRVAVNGLADGRFTVDIFPEGVQQADRIVGRIETLDGQAVGETFSAEVRAGEEKVLLSTQIKQPKLWSAETPNLYRFRGTLMAGDRPIHEVTTRFGFRTFEVRAGAGFFLNSRRIILQGLNRHCFRPETGRALNPADSLADVRLLKEMNANAVRTSHYPPDQAFLDYCDELGLYVIDELCTWQKPILDTPPARRLVRELVERDVNHASILFWANGNEGGFNFDVDDDYAKYDPQNRPVLHPWTNFRGIDTAHYRTFDQHRKKLEGPSIYLPTEFLHGLYDGGMGAGLEDYWKAIRASKFGGGGFLWALADEGVVRTDEGGRIDTDGNHAPDGIVGPQHEHEGSFDTVRAIWSPVQIPLLKLPADFDGRVPVKNEFSFTSLSDVRFEWALLDFSPPAAAPQTTVRASGKIAGPTIAPEASGQLELPLPTNWREAQALRLVATGPDGRSLRSWVWAITPRAKVLETIFRAGSSTDGVTVGGGDGFTVRSGKAEFQFSPVTGQLIRATVGGKTVPLSNGPRLVAASADQKTIPASGTATVRTSNAGGNVVIEAEHSAGLSHFKWTVKPGGVLQLDYQGELPAAKYHYAGIGFDLEDRAVKSKRWLGGGPFRVWANRLAGPTLGVWENGWNNGVAGEVWDLPEFKGVFKEVAWMRLDCGALAITVGLPDEAALLGVLRPPNGADPKQTTYGYPDADGLFVFHAIPAIGNKFHAPEKVGPQSQPTGIGEPLVGSVWLLFE
jgi:hypothetical protein